MDFVHIIQIVSNVIIIISAIIAGIWSLYRFWKLREAKKALSLEIFVSVLRHGNNNLLEANILLTNTGTIPIYGSIPNNPNCLVEFKGIPPSSCNKVINWNDSDLVELAPPVPYLKQYDELLDNNLHKEAIILEPGVPSEIQGYAVFSTEFNGLVYIKAQFVDSHNTWWIVYKIIEISGFKS